jgi:3-oxoacyl-[acyl-carrier-protein] synthase-3
MKYSKITGWGMSVPERVVTNHDLEQIVDTTDEWIVTHTGIRERHIAGEGETTSTLSIAAGQQALERAGLAAKDLDLIIVATSSPDHFLPPVASQVQDGLGAKRAGAFVLTAGCTGFVYGLATAHQFITSGAYRNILVIGTEIISSFLNWEDRRTCVLFGDDSGAVVLQASDEPGGVLSFVLGSDGSKAEALIVRGMGSAMPVSHEVLDNNWHVIEMKGSTVAKFAMKVLAGSPWMTLTCSSPTSQTCALSSLRDDSWVFRLRRFSSTLTAMRTRRLRPFLLHCAKHWIPAVQKKGTPSCWRALAAV